MNSEVSFVFPNQLFEHNPCLDKHRRVYLIEDDLFFKQLPFHKQKLMMHHASMHFYQDHLNNKGFRTSFIDCESYPGMELFFKRVLRSEVKVIHVCDPVDYLLELKIYDSPNFFNTEEINQSQLGDRKTYFMADFYKKQRQRLGILCEGNKPEGGAWSFDTENRKSLPKGHQVPMPWIPKESHYIRIAKEWVERLFPNNPGETDEFYYPVTFLEAKEQCAHYFEHRFHAFGVYQDAFSDDFPFLYHSCLSAPLNSGLISPKEMVDAALEAYKQGAPLNSVEGFIRQIIGWREYVRAVYVREGVYQRTRNFWNFENRLDLEAEQYQPLVKTHNKVLRYAYGHHIERLMLFGNFFTLAKVHPNDVYEYFMTHFIDAYDWVMVPNVYGMSLHADGGKMTTKPYISSSSYLKKQGFKLCEEKAFLWDSLFWNFISEHESFFTSNPRMKPMVFQLYKMSDEKRQRHLETARIFFEKNKTQKVVA
jgi:deoxyribodipyrimidine photolyase-related protein